MWVVDSCIVLVPAIVVWTCGVEKLHLEVFMREVSYLGSPSLLKMLLSSTLLMNPLLGISLVMTPPSFSRNFPSSHTTLPSISISTVTTIILPSKLFQSQVLKLPSSVSEQLLSSYTSHLRSSPTPTSHI